MKIRNGFVSNSSSTSFCIYGVCEESEIESEVLEELLSGSGLEYYNDYNSYYWVGKSWSSMREDQTLGDFKKEVAELLKERLGAQFELRNIGFHEETIEN